MLSYEEDDYVDEEVEDFLEHFGVLGMRWGFRKEDRVIRKENRLARREKKAGKFDRRAAALQTKISEIENKRVKDSLDFFDLEMLQKKQSVAEKSAQQKREGKLTSRQKKVLVGAGATAALLAAYGTYSSVNSGNARRLTEQGKYFLKNWQNPHTPIWNKDVSLANPNLSADEVMDKVVKHVNPEFGKLGSKMNCRRATYAYEMRRRGYDVQATRTLTGRGQEATGDFNVLNLSPGDNLVAPGVGGIFTRLISEGRKPEGQRHFTQALRAKESPWGKNKISLPQAAFPTLDKQPVGARGELGIGWEVLGGHSVSWEKFKDGVVVFDNQTNKKYTNARDLNEFLKNAKEVAYTRLDDVPLNSNFLLRWLKDA